ncbi:glycosyltransferase family 2 protein [Sphingomonas sp. RB3P16]|uniref:glycosyltransferase family 2 protein n=1 Tax=Parasphingomonas frigoris TaxID=3096163 RepID=UPI002FCB966F
MSVAIATYNAQDHLRAAVASALAQTLADIEVIIVDDCSQDGTWDLVQQLAQSDPRIVIDRLARNGGPAAARNRALALARGAWFAVLDSDDLFVRDRLARLVAAGDAVDADIVADNLVVFDDADPTQATFFLASDTKSDWISNTQYLRRTMMYASGPNLGYLKPMIRVDRLRALDLRYDEQLRISEDDDFVLRMLAAGLRYWLEPVPGYAYRRHGNSISHRLSARNAAAIVIASAQLTRAAAAEPDDVRALLAARHAAFARSEAFARLIDALKARRAGRALAIALKTPAIVPMLRMPIEAALRRITKRPVASMVERPEPAAAAIVVPLLASVAAPA